MDLGSPGAGGPGDTLSPSESTDSDKVRNDDGDIVVDPPDGWSEADKFGMTEREEREGWCHEIPLSSERQISVHTTLPKPRLTIACR